MHESFTPPLAEAEIIAGSSCKRGVQNLTIFMRTCWALRVSTITQSLPQNHIWKKRRQNPDILTGVMRRLPSHNTHYCCAVTQSINLSAALQQSTKAGRPADVGRWRGPPSLSLTSVCVCVCVMLRRSGSALLRLPFLGNVTQNG